jgi:hypothetical protein
MTLDRSLSLLFALALLFVFAAPSESFAKDKQRIRVDLTNTGEQPAADGKAEFRLKKRNRMRFKVEVEDLTPANYDLVVAGVVRGTLDVRQLADGSVEGELEFDSKRRSPSASGRKLPLAFDPRGQLIEVVRSAIVYMQVTMPATDDADDGN